jgi:hypothetical protein
VAVICDFPTGCSLVGTSSFVFFLLHLPLLSPRVCMPNALLYVPDELVLRQHEFSVAVDVISVYLGDDGTRTRHLMWTYHTLRRCSARSTPSGSGRMRPSSSGGMAPGAAGGPAVRLE